MIILEEIYRFGIKSEKVKRCLAFLQLLGYEERVFLHYIFADIVS